jgi:serine/threonine-protein kinase 24/25/MST4
MRSDWNFDTVRTISALGTFQGNINDLSLPVGMIAEDDESFDDIDGQDSIDTGAATKGSDPLANSLGMSLLGNSEASHSTVVIKAPRAPESKDPDAAEAPAGNWILTSCAVYILMDSLSGAPPAYSGSLRSPRRASYASRSSVDGPGTVLREADIGTGVDTIRPVKKVDPAGSLRLSAEFLGSMRKEASLSSSPRSPTHKRTSSEVGKAGRSLVDEVVLPILSKVSILFSCDFFRKTNFCFFLDYS